MDLIKALVEALRRPTRPSGDGNCPQCGAQSGHWPSCPNYPFL